MATLEPDGRTARTQRTREAIVDSLLALMSEGIASPSATQIAERAGISKRSIFVHYATLEDLYADLAERGTAMVLERVWVIDADLPLEERIEQVCAQRADIHESIGPLRRAAAVRVATSATAADSQRFARDASRVQLSRVFAAELACFDAAERSRREAALDAVVSGEAWDLWRTIHGLGVEDATATMRSALAALLAAPRN